jgi:hypothetical protein
MRSSSFWQRKFKLLGLELIEASRASILATWQSGTVLPCLDWDENLDPIDPTLRERMDLQP